MKSIFSVLISLACVAALARPVNSMLGADGTELQIEEVSYTASDYVRDGLVCMFDAIENVEYGVHDESATRWTDLISGNSYAIGTGNFFGDNYLQVDANTSRFIPTKDIMNSGNFTIEVVGFCRGSQACVSLGQYPYAFSPYFSWDESQKSGYFVFARTTMDGPSGTCGQNRMLSAVATYNEGIATIWFPKEYLQKSSATEIPSTLTKDSNLQRSHQGSVGAIRLYDRALTEEEVYHNFEIDKERFGIW